MQVTEILQVIKPYVLGWIETGGEEGGYAPSPHELDGAHHIGTLTTSQYPDALLRDGSRSLTGNLSVGAGITVDGVDLSAFKTAYDSHVLAAAAHHNPISLDANADAILSLSVQQLGLDTQAAARVFAGPTSGAAAIPTFRALVSTDIPALGGTPALVFTTSNAAGSATTYIRTDASLAIFDATAPTTIQPDDAAAAGSAAFAARRDHKHAIVAEAPGNQAIGDSAAEGTATSFARSDHKHGMPSFATPSVVLGTVAAAGSATTLLRSDCTIVAFDATAPTTIQPDDAAAAGSAAVAARRDHKHAIAAAAATTLTVASTNTEGAGNDFARATHTHAITTSNNPGAAAAILASSAAGALTLVNLTLSGDFDPYRVADHLIPKTTDTYDLGSSTLLWRKGWLSEMEAVLFAENTITLLGGWFYITKYAGTAQEDIDDSETAIDLGVTDSVLAVNDFIVFRQALQVEYMQLTSYAGSNIWNVTRNVDGSGANAWPQGAPFAVFGYDGDGRIELNAYDTPRISIMKHGTTYNAQDELIRLGDLNGLADYSSEEYGIFIGDYSGDSWMAYDQTNGLRIRGNAIIDGTLQATAFTNDIGALFFSQADGLALWGPGCAITPTSWTSTRGQVATLSGAFHQVAGPWAQSRALVVEPEATNLIKNPSIEVGTTGYGALGAGTTVTRVTTDSVYGSACLEVAAADVAGAGVSYGIGDRIAVSEGVTYTLSLFARVTSEATRVVQLQIPWFDALSGGSTISTSTLDVTLTNAWTRFIFTATAPAGALGGRFSILRQGTGTHTYLIDGIQFEATGYASSYLDGSLGTGYTWNGDGTAHANTSTRAATVVNLDAHAPMLSDLATVTHSIWVQAQYDADADPTAWSSTPPNDARIIDYRGADNNNHFIFRYSPTYSDSFFVWINGTDRITAVGQTFKAGDWLHLVVTLDYTNDLYYLYLNGALIGSSTTALTAPTGLVDWILGTIYTGGSGYYGGWAFGEYAVFNRALIAEEVAALYAQGKPLADVGALKRPGIYIMDGEIDVRTSQTGARVQIDSDGIGGYSATTTKTFSLETDGDLFLGSNIGAAATTAFAVFATAQTYNSESVGAGDVLLGDNSAGKANVLWDVSTGDISIRRGQTTRIWLDGSADTVLIGLTGSSQCNALLTSSTFELRQGTTTRIKLDGSASTLLIGQAAASQNNVLISSGAISIRNNETERIGITAAGILTIKDSSGNAVMTFDASAGAEITKTLAMKGSTAVISIGETPPTSSTVGTGVWIDRTGLYGLYSNAYQVKIDATTGALVAGAGGVQMDVGGLKVFSDTSYAAGKAINFYDGATRIGEIYLRALGDPLYTNWMEIGTEAIAAKNSQIRVQANAPASYQGQISLEVVQASGLSPYFRMYNGASYETIETNCVFVIGNSTAAPAASVTNSVVLYALDVASSSELRVRDEAGNVTTLSPHNFGLIPGGPSEPLAWAYYGERDGVAINVDMLRLARLMEQLTGEKLVHISKLLT